MIDWIKAGEKVQSVQWLYNNVPDIRRAIDRECTIPVDVPPIAPPVVKPPVPEPTPVGEKKSLRVSRLQSDIGGNEMTLWGKGQAFSAVLSEKDKTD